MYDCNWQDRIMLNVWFHCRIFVIKWHKGRHILTYCNSWRLEVSVWNSMYGTNFFMWLYSFAKNKILPYSQGRVIISSCNLQNRNWVYSFLVGIATIHLYNAKWNCPEIYLIFASDVHSYSMVTKALFHNIQLVMYEKQMWCFGCPNQSVDSG